MSIVFRTNMKLEPCSLVNPPGQSCYIYSCEYLEHQPNSSSLVPLIWANNQQNRTKNRQTWVWLNSGSRNAAGDESTFGRWQGTFYYSLGGLLPAHLWKLSYNHRAHSKVAACTLSVSFIHSLFCFTFCDQDRRPVCCQRWYCHRWLC